jgi:CRISPR-associated protein Cmr3
MDKRTWIELNPIDTLFFKGAESMVAGEHHEVDTLFPPMPSTIIGAIRTAIMRQNQISPADYLRQPSQWQEKYPILGLPDEPGFELTGPLFCTGTGSLLLPAPANWFAASPAEKAEWGRPYSVQTAQPLTASSLGISGSVPNPVWLTHPKGPEMKSLSGWWVTAATFDAVCQNQDVLFTKDIKKLQADTPAILPMSLLFGREERVGIALTPERTAKEGHLYSTVHVVLHEDVSLLVGINSPHDLCLKQEGILQLGGEQRICRYRIRESIALPENQSGQTQLALGPIKMTDLPEAWKGVPRCSGKLLRIGGWDMAKGFHKPMTAWLPHGTVFFTNERPNLSQLMSF